MSFIEALVAGLKTRVPRTVEDPSRSQAAVAIILVPGPDQMLLIRRAEHERDPWSGQMGLPGGRRDPGDADLLATVLRETREEIGVDLDRATLIGTMDDLAPITPVLPPIIVRPHLFLLAGMPGPLVLSGEVQYVRWAGVAELGSPQVYRPYNFEHRGVPLTRPAYHLDNDVVWGMTERILTPVLEMMRSR